MNWPNAEMKQIRGIIKEKSDFCVSDEFRLKLKFGF